MPIMRQITAKLALANSRNPDFAARAIAALGRGQGISGRAAAAAAAARRAAASGY
jgi:hypothetical protein